VMETWWLTLMSPMKLRVPACKWWSRHSVCASSINRHVRVACFIAFPEMSVCCNRVRGGTIRRAARIKIPVPSFAWRNVLPCSTASFESCADSWARASCHAGGHGQVSKRDREVCVQITTHLASLSHPSRSPESCDQCITCPAVGVQSI
jgi:hypothetical protein